MTAHIIVTLKEGVLDPQGKALHHALHALGFNEVLDARVNKHITLSLTGGDVALERAKVEQMCETLIANTVIENYSIEILP